MAPTSGRVGMEPSRAVFERKDCQELGLEGLREKHYRHREWHVRRPRGRGSLVCPNKGCSPACSGGSEREAGVRPLGPCGPVCA